MISAIYNFALTTGANRVIRGARIEHVCGDPNLGPEKDYAYGMRIVRTALEAVQTAVTGPTLFDPMDMALEQLLGALKAIIQAKPSWPVVVAQTTLHHGYPPDRYEHGYPYPFASWPWPATVPA